MQALDNNNIITITINNNNNGRNNNCGRRTIPSRIASALLIFSVWRSARKHRLRDKQTFARGGGKVHSSN
jgi:hypothetical protein